MPASRSLMDFAKLVDVFDANQVRRQGLISFSAKRRRTVSRERRSARPAICYLSSWRCPLQWKRHPSLTAQAGNAAHFRVSTSTGTSPLFGAHFHNSDR